MRREIAVWILLAASSAALALGVQAQAASPAATAESRVASFALQRGEGRVIAHKLADELLSSFVLHDEAEDYAAMLGRNAAAGRYDQGTRGGLAKLMSDDLMAVHKDGHLRVMLADPNDAKDSHGNPPPPKDLPPLIQSAKTIAPGVGYIRFTAFWGTPDEVAGVRKWLDENRDDKVLIFDLRNNHGGGIDEIDVIFSYLFGKKTPMVKMAMSKTVYEQQKSDLDGASSMVFAVEGDNMVGTHSALPGPDTPLRRAKIYLLVSNQTASAAEHFSLALKSTGRAILIGEATAGADHFGGPQPLNDHFAVWMPVGRTYDVKTGKDWEGAGIEPQIAVDPEQALVVALEKAGLSHEQAVKLNANEVPARPVHADKLRSR